MSKGVGVGWGVDDNYRNNHDSSKVETKEENQEKTWRGRQSRETLTHTQNKRGRGEGMQL